MSEIDPTPDVVFVGPPATDSRRKALVALVLLVTGATMLTVGVSLVFGVPVGLITLGVLILVGGVALGVS